MFLAKNTSCGKALAIPSLFISAARDGVSASASRLHKDPAAVKFIHWRPPLVKNTKRQLDSAAALQIAWVRKSLGFTFNAMVMSK